MEKMSPLAWFRGISRKKQLVVMILLSFLPVVSQLFTNQSPTQSPESASPESIDTLIPSGSVLIPIQVENSESLDSILGQKGIVDLHSPAREPGGKNRVVARRLPILRAPLNPQQFAVLAPEDQAQLIVREPGPFWVVVQNPSRFGTQFERASTKPRKKRVIVDGGVE